MSFAEVEAKVAAVPGVYECAAAAVPHPEAARRWPCILCRRRSSDVIDQVRHSLPAHWTCESIQIVSEIPKTARGKVSRDASADGR